MSDSGNPTPKPKNASLAKIDEIVKRFLADAEQHEFPVFLICAAYRELDGGWRFRTRVDGDSNEILGALNALMSMLTPEDYEKLMQLQMNEHPEIAAFRQLNRLPNNGMVN